MPLDSTHPVVFQAKSYEYVTSAERAWKLLRSLEPEEVYALDFETTSLSPSEGKVRLTSIAGHGQQFILDHYKCGEFESFAPFMAGREWAVFAATFEGRWFDYNSPDVWVTLLDVQYMRKAKLGGQPLKLRDMCKRDLKFDMDKEEQNSNWSATVLSKSQLDYAILDAVATYALWEYWLGELTAEQYEGFLNVNEAWRGTVEMEDCGLQLDVKYHTKLLQWWTLKRDTAERYLRRWTPPDIIANLNSKKQISDFLKYEMLDEKTVATWPRTNADGKTKSKTDQLNTERDTLRMAAYRLPYPQSRWLGALIILNKYNKYISTYGQKLIDAQLRLGMVPSRFNIAQAVTGRYSSSSFNLQNIPRNPVVRRSFTVPSRGDYRLVMADYSSIEVRVLAEMSGDKTLLNDAIYGDVHSRSASQIFKVDFDYFTEVINSEDSKYDNVRPVFKDMRSRSKAFTFQLLYGASGPALAIVLRCTDDEAFKAIDAWAEVYPKAYHQRTLWFERMNFDGFLPVQDGRTIYVFKQDRRMPVAANYPVQGTAASVMYRAVKHVHADLFTSGVSARLAATVHDELLTFSRSSCAEECAQVVSDGMVKGWLDIFPGTDTANLVGKGNKATIGMNWGEKK